jgi:Glucokinase
MSGPDQIAVLADVGGTNTRVALAHGANVDPDNIRRFRNADHGGLPQVLRQYLADSGAQVDAACVAMAGPVRAGVGRLTNLDWVVDSQAIAQATGAARVSVLNDLQAQGHPLAQLGTDSLQTLCPGATDPASDTRLALGLGTGVNAAVAVSAHGRTVVPPSEAGHVSLPPAADPSGRLHDILLHVHGECSVEAALAGRGVAALYAWHMTHAGLPGPRLTPDAVMRAD